MLKTSFKKLCIGTKLGEALQKMSSAKSIPEGLKMLDGGMRTWHGQEELPNMPHSRARPGTRHAKEEQNNHVIHPDAPQQLERAKSGDLGIWDSRAVSVACPYCYARMQADLSWYHRSQWVPEAAYCEIDAVKA